MLLFSCHISCRIHWVWWVQLHGPESESDVVSGLDAFTDLVCAGIPIFVIYRLQMNIRTKVALCVLMGLGVL